MDTTRRPGYPSDGSDDERAFLAPYLTLMREDAPQRKHALPELFNGLRYIARTGLQWRFMPADLPPWPAVYQQTRRWLDAEVFDAIIADLRELIRFGEDRSPQPSAMILDSRTLQSTPESSHRAGWDGAKRRKGSKVHLAVATPGQLLAVHVSPAGERDRAHVAELAGAVQDATGETVALTFVRATPARCRAGPPPTTASSWRSSSCPEPSADPCCCRGAGWSSGTTGG